MTEIAQTAAPGITTPHAAAPDKDGAAAATAASDFKTFLTLLTTQLKNQDPMAPLDSTQFVEQLASFSAVEQQIETNTLLRKLVGDATGGDPNAAAHWIGREIEAPLEAAPFAGAPLRFRIAPEASSEVVVRDAQGKAVHREKVQPGAAEFVWSGAGQDGLPAAPGLYSVRVETPRPDGAPISVPAHAVAEVVEARLVDGEWRLVLDSGATVAIEKVAGVRAKANAAA